MGRPIGQRYNSNPANAGHRITATANLGSGNVTAYIGKQLSNNHYIFTTATGSGATATAHLSGNAVSTVTVTAAGSGYHQSPTVIFYNGDGTGAAATTVSLKAVSATVVAGGSGYAVGNTITLTNGVVLTVATLVNTDHVATVTVTTPGSFSGSLASNPVSQASTSGSGTGATFNVSYGINTITVTSGGSGYVFAPSVKIVDNGVSHACKLVQGSPSGVGQAEVVVTPFFDKTATGTATISGGVVTKVTITDGGSGYTSAPAITFGSGAASATAVITQFVDHINVTAGGTGYVEPPKVTLSGGGGTGATAQAVLNGNGTVVAVLVTAAGTGYTSAPTVGFTPVIGGTGAAATAVINGKVTSITGLSGGTGYGTAPTVTFAAPAGVATAESAKIINQSTVKTFEGHEYRWSTSAPTGPTQASLNLS